MTIELNLLCAGAAQGLVKALAPRLLAEADATIGGRFGAVGAMRDALHAGEPCDLMVVTDAMVGTLAHAGHLHADTRAPLGRVRTGVAVRRGLPAPDVSTPEALAAALRAADAIYFPDAVRSTAGIHFLSVMRQLGLDEELAPRFRTFPNGATAMREMAASTSAQPIGCTQVTEILYTEGVDLVSVLPQRFELATTYTGAVATQARHPELAQRLLALMTGPDSAELRQRSGFEA